MDEEFTREQQARRTTVDRKDRAGIAKRLLEIGAECVALAAETPEGREWLAKNYNDELYDDNGLPK